MAYRKVLAGWVGRPGGHHRIRREDTQWQGARFPGRSTAQDSHAQARLSGQPQLKGQ
jgi:hypothetical protein